MHALFISGLISVSPNHVSRKARCHAACTGLTGLTGFPAHVCAYVPAPSYQYARKDISPRVRTSTLITLLTLIKPLCRKALRLTGLRRVSDNPCYTRLTMKKPSMREQMPLTAAWIDSLRQAFGAEMIDGQIRKGMRGEPVFFASENGHAVGTPSDGAIKRGQGK